MICLIEQIAGTIIAPGEPKDWDPKNPRIWLCFSRLNEVIIQGGGLITGSGTKWWESSCKTNKSNVNIPTSYEMIIFEHSSVALVQVSTNSSSCSPSFLSVLQPCSQAPTVSISPTFLSPKTQNIMLSLRFSCNKYKQITDLTHILGLDSMLLFYKAYLVTKWDRPDHTIHASTIVYILKMQLHGKCIKHAQQF